MSEEKEDIGRAFLIHESRRYQITSVHCDDRLIDNIRDVNTIA
jgi:hypothetical protein